VYSPTGKHRRIYPGWWEILAGAAHSFFGYSFYLYAWSAIQATAPGISGRPVHYLRTAVPYNEESIVGYAKRLPSNRHNAYFAPGGLAGLRNGGLLASDCRNTTNPQTLPVVGSAPPCRQQPPWTFDGQTAYFPHVDRAPGR